MDPPITIAAVYPKDWYDWTDRTGITGPDISGPIETSSFTQTSTADAGTLLITADGTIPGAVIGIAVVLWDERDNSTSVFSGGITLSTWATNEAGNYVAQGIGLAPGFLVVDVSLAAAFTILVQSLARGTINLHYALR